MDQVESTEEATSEVEETQQDTVETDTTDQETSTDETNEETVPKDNAAWAAMRAENKRLKESARSSEVDEAYLKELEGITGRQEYQPQYRPEQLEEMDETSRQIPRQTKLLAEQ